MKSHADGAVCFSILHPSPIIQSSVVQRVTCRPPSQGHALQYTCGDAFPPSACTSRQQQPSVGTEEAEAAQRERQDRWKSGRDLLERGDNTKGRAGGASSAPK